MDTETFLVRRKILQQDLETRRSQDLSVYPHQMFRDYGVPLPSWSRWLLTMVSRRGAISQFLSIVLPIAAPFLAQRRKSFLMRLFEVFTLPRA